MRGRRLGAGPVLLTMLALALGGAASPSGIQAQQRVDWGGLFPGSAVSCTGHSLCATQLRTSLQEGEGPASATIFAAAIAGAVVLGAVGSFVGLGLATDGDSYDWDGLGGLVLGYWVGSTVGAAGAADWADGPPGTFGRRLLGSAVAGAVTFGAGLGTESGLLVLSIPLVQALTMAAWRYDWD